MTYLINLFYWLFYYRRVRIVLRAVVRDSHRYSVYYIPLTRKGKPLAMASPVTVNVGHTVSCSLVFKDQSGNPMVPTPTPDAPPVWANGNPSVDTLVAAADGMTAVDTAVAVGTDTVSVDVVVGGTHFTAQLPVTVTPVPQVLTSVDIAAVVS